MNSIELRTLLQESLLQRQGSQYGDVFSVEAPSPAPGQPSLRVIVPDPSGVLRTYEVSIQEV